MLIATFKAGVTGRTLPAVVSVLLSKRSNSCQKPPADLPCIKTGSHDHYSCKVGWQSEYSRSSLNVSIESWNYDEMMQQNQLYHR